MSGPYRTSDGLDGRRRRMLYRAWHRGTKEMDLIYGGFADAHIDTLNDAELDEFEALMAQTDQDVFSWICGDIAVPAEFDRPLFARLKAFSPSAA